MAGSKTTRIVLVAAIALILFTGMASAATDIEYKKGTQIKTEPTGITGIKQIQFIAECNGIMTVSSTANRVDVLSSCKPRNLYIQFIVPNDMAVYQTKDSAGQKIAIRVLQKRIAVSEDGRMNIILTKLESTGRFEFLGDLVYQNDNFIIENAADQTLKANMKTISIETIMQKDEEFYNSLQATNLSSIDKRFFNRVKNTMDNIGLGWLFKNLNNALTNIIGG